MKTKIYQSLLIGIGSIWPFIFYGYSIQSIIVSYCAFVSFSFVILNLV